jgi:hypothetical protein
LAILVNVFANLDAGQHAFTDVTPVSIFWNSVAFCFFTMPAACFLGVPLYLRFRQLNLLRVLVATVAGALAGLAIPYALVLLAAVVSFQRPAVLPWQVRPLVRFGGAAPGALVGILLHSSAASVAHAGSRRMACAANLCSTSVRTSPSTRADLPWSDAGR